MDGADGGGDGVANPALLADALAGLGGTPKRLHPKWLYDDRGSALFERITGLPEYDLTRNEAAILRDNAAAIAAHLPAGGALAELGAGAATKTRLLLDAAPHLEAYVPIDISAAFLAQTAAGLRRDHPGLAIHPLAADFTTPVALPGAVAGMAVAGLFLGSTVGNLARADAVALLAGARTWPGAEAFVLGADLVKDEADLVAAYDDAQGVTAAFIGGILHRLRAEAGAEIDPDAFAYEARWDAARAAIDMALVSRRAQTVRLGGTAIPFAESEPIIVSTSRKFTTGTLAALARDGGWRVAEVLTDARARFAVGILQTDR